MNEQLFILFGVSLSEASFDDSKRTVEMIALTKGWSANGFYYTDRALSDVAMLLQESATKVYLNHNPRKEAFEPRKVEHHIANNLTSVVTEAGQVKVTAKFFESGPEAWVYDRMKEDKGSLGPSIVGKAIVKKGTAEGRKGNIVESIPWLHSYDMVSRPSAGGTVENVQESIMYIGESLETWTSEQEEAEEKVVVVPGLKAKIKSIKKQSEIRDKFQDIRWTFSDMINDIVFAIGDFQFMPIPKRRLAMKALLDEFAIELAKIPFANPKSLPQKEGVTESENEFKIGEFSIAEDSVCFDIADGVQGVIEDKEIVGYLFEKREGWTEEKIIEWCDNNLVEKGEDSMAKNLVELKAQNPELCDQLIQESEASNASSVEFKQLQEDVKGLAGLKEKITAFETQVSDLGKEKDILIEEKKTLEESVKSFDSEKQKLTIDKVVSEAKSSSGLSEEFFTEAFETELKALVFENEEAFKTAVEVKVDNLKAVVTLASKGSKAVIEGAVMPKETKKVSEGTSITSDNKAAAKSLKRVA